MTSTDPNLLRVNEGPVNDLLAGSRTAFGANPMPSVDNLALAANTVSMVLPKSIITTYGATHYFEINQQIPEVRRFRARVTCSPITVTGGTYCRIVDAFPIWLFRDVSYVDPNYGTIQTYPPEQIYCEYLKQGIITQRDNELMWLIGFNDAVRSSLAASGFSFEYEIPSWIHERLENTLRCQNIDVPLQIRLTTRNLNELVQTDGTNPQGTMTIVLDFIGRIPTEAERNQTGSVINSKMGQLMQIRDSFYFEPPMIPAGTTTITFPIDQIKGPVNRLDFLFRLQSEVNGSSGSPLTNDFTNFDNSFKPIDMEIKSGNEYILQRTAIKQLVSEARSVNYPNSLPEEQIASVTFSEFPHLAATANSSYLDFNFIAKPMVTLYFNSPTSQNISVGICAFTNVFIQHQAGTIRAVTSQ